MGKAVSRYQRIGDLDLEVRSGRIASKLLVIRARSSEGQSGHCFGYGIMAVR